MDFSSSDVFSAVPSMLVKSRKSPSRRSAADRMAALRILGRGPDRQEEDLQRLVELLVPQTPLPLQLATARPPPFHVTTSVPTPAIPAWASPRSRLNMTASDGRILVVVIGWDEIGKWG